MFMLASGKCYLKTVLYPLDFCLSSLLWLCSWKPIGIRSTGIQMTPLRWSETKNLKRLIIDNFFSCHLIAMKLCTLIELRNTQPKLKSQFF